LDLEVKALQKLKKKISNSFNQVVNRVVNCQSKVILTGVGKSGLIANKIAATLSSVGYTMPFQYQQVTPLMVIWALFQKKIF
jgi:D-arabinose 5-phosphate isomerase GutQ